MKATLPPVTPVRFVVVSATEPLKLSAPELVRVRVPTLLMLVPVTPFALGGEFNLQNLQALDAVKGMQLRADIWRQTRHLPDGTKVQFKIT